MKSILKNLFLVGLCCLVSLTAFAGGQIGWMTIESMVQRECVPGKGLEITFTTPHANPDVCANNKVIEVSCDLPTYKAVLAMALTVQSASLEMNGYVNACDSDNQAILKSIRIR